MVDGLRVIFDFTVDNLLMYGPERQQFNDIRNITLDPPVRLSTRYYKQIRWNIHQAYHDFCNNQKHILFNSYFYSMLENEIQDMENNLTREVRVLEALPTTSDAKGETIYNKI